jgi:hypothetical protein
MGNSSRTFLLCAFLFVTISSAILPALSLQYSSTGISSYGAVNYSGTGEKIMINALWCTYGDLSSTFLNRIVAGKITQFDILYAHWEGNTLVYNYADSDWNYFINQVKSVVPTATFYAWIASSPPYNPPDISTPSNRQNMVNQLIPVANKPYLNGIFDDTEYYTGTEQNHFDYFNLGASTIEPIKRYYPWMYPTWMPYVNSQRDSVGAYNGNAWHESEWKSRLDLVNSYANVGYIWGLMAGDEGASGVSLSMQLAWFDDKIAANGWPYYSKLEAIEIYWYLSMSDADWNAWINWPTKG